MLQMFRRDIRNRKARFGQQVFYRGLVRIGEDVHTASNEIDLKIPPDPLFQRGKKEKREQIDFVIERATSCAMTHSQ
jgi:hypothetical protein